MLTTTLSSKGQIIIPSALRTAHHWEAGTEFIIEDTGDGVLLKPRKPFPATCLESGLGCAGYTGPAKSLEEIEQGLNEAMRRQWTDETK